MMTRYKAVRILLALGGLFAVLAAGAGPASAFGISSHAACDDQAVLRAIAYRFSINDRNVLKQGLAIDAYVEVQENRYQPAYEGSMIDRRFCQGRVAMNDGRTRTIWYMIEAGQGLAGFGGNVDYCIAGLDPWRIYGANCQSVRQ